MELKVRAVISSLYIIESQAVLSKAEERRTAKIIILIILKNWVGTKDAENWVK